MKLLCILISFTCVNVLVAIPDVYLDKVFKTNELVAQAEDVLPKIITNIVQADQQTYSSRDIAFMLLVPEIGLIDNYGDLATCQDWMQAEIMKVKVFDEPTTSESTALLSDNTQPSDSTLSKLGKITRVMTGKGVNSIKFLFSGLLGDAIDVNEKALIELGNTRRVLIRKAVKILVKGVLDGENQDFQGIKTMCNLIGLIRSILYRHTFVKNATVQGEFCVLTEIIGGVISYQHDGNNNYREITKYGERGPDLSDLLTEFLNMDIR